MLVKSTPERNQPALIRDCEGLAKMEESGFEDVVGSLVLDV
jgi:hypothetical protein